MSLPAQDPTGAPMLVPPSQRPVPFPCSPIPLSTAISAPLPPKLGGAEGGVSTGLAHALDLACPEAHHEPELFSLISSHGGEGEETRPVILRLELKEVVGM